MRSLILSVLASIFFVFICCGSAGHQRSGDDVQHLLQTNRCEKCNLAGVNLIEKSLVAATLAGANLTGAILYRADLLQADLRDAILINADLRNAHLRMARLEGARLNGAQVSGAVIGVQWKDFVKKSGVVGFGSINWVE